MAELFLSRSFNDIKPTIIIIIIIIIITVNLNTILI